VRPKTQVTYVERVHFTMCVEAWNGMEWNSHINKIIGYKRCKILYNGDTNSMD